MSFETPRIFCTLWRSSQRVHYQCPKILDMRLRVRVQSKKEFLHLREVSIPMMVLAFLNPPYKFEDLSVRVHRFGKTYSMDHCSTQLSAK